MLHSASRIRKPVGIDLGTTNSVIALLDDAGANLVTGRDEQGRVIFPSLVGFDPSTNQLVPGRAAAAPAGGTPADPVSRRRLADYEGLASSGDPSRGGDDFDRALATHLVQSGSWKWDNGDTADVAELFAPTRPDGAVPFARLVRIA